LLHGNETRVWVDQAYQGQSEVIRQRVPRAKDFRNRIFRRHGTINDIETAKNRSKSPVAGQGRARDRGDKACAWLSEGALSGTGEEPASPAGYCGVDEPVYGWSQTSGAAGAVSVNRAKRCQVTMKSEPLQRFAAIRPSLPSLFSARVVMVAGKSDLSLINNLERHRPLMYIPVTNQGEIS
jgi:hypothetical protein